MKPNLGDVIADKYRLDRVLGEGGMSTVYAAANVLTGKQVAVKWLQPELTRDEERSQRLLREAQATSTIDHPNVVHVFEVGSHEGGLFLVMELLQGEPLSELLMRGARDPLEFVRLMMPVLRGVHAAHRVGVVHRDLKPDNIFLCRDLHGESREPKVLDFGISRVTGHALEAGLELTREGTVLGTPQYMAPEQIRDAGNADVRSDVYALGVLFYRAFSNEYPYDADTLTALAIHIVEGNAVPLIELAPELDPGLATIVMRALALDPAQRFESVAALAEALEPYANGLLFAPSVLARENVPAIGRESTAKLERLPSSRPFAPPPPPPPPRTGAQRERNHPAARRDDESSATWSIDTRELSREEPQRESEPALLRREHKRTVPPPPAPTLSRPSRGLVVDESSATHRVERGARKHGWGLGLVLLTLGLIAPLGWQQWQKARGASARVQARPAWAPAIGKTANVYAAQALRPRSPPQRPTPVAVLPNEPAAIGATRASPDAPNSEPKPERPQRLAPLPVVTSLRMPTAEPEQVEALPVVDARSPAPVGPRASASAAP